MGKIGIVIIVISLLAYLICACVVANEVKEIVKEKGYEEKAGGYCGFTFFFWVLGILLAIALPDRNNKMNENYKAYKDSEDFTLRLKNVGGIFKDDES